MSLINRFFQKAPADAEASRPSATSTRPGAGEAGGDRKAERSEHREQLYAVVREAMTRAGVLSTSFKFKVLSLDSRGSNFLIMMDLVSSAAEESSRLAEIEALVMHNANVLAPQRLCDNRVAIEGRQWPNRTCCRSGKCPQSSGRGRGNAGL
jgi:hypothetical protein